MKRLPKHLLIELPTADEIDDLALTSPSINVRKVEFDFTNKKADLNYSPCKGQLVLVARGEKGTALVRAKGANEWLLPSGRIAPNESIEKAARRVAREECGIMLRSLEVAAMYDVVWHYADVSIKRLHVVYAAITDDLECAPEKPEGDKAAFFVEIPDDLLSDEICAHALADCSAK